MNGGKLPTGTEPVVSQASMLWPPKRHGPPQAIRTALDRYRLATSAPHAAWGFDSRWGTVRGVATHDRASIDRSSRAPRLVLLHGLAVSHRYLMPVAARLAEHHPVNVIDLPGFGLSGEPGRVLNVAEHADHVAAWLETSGLAPVVILGNSFGCQVAVDLAVRHPHLVRGLALVGPTVDPTARTVSRQILRWLRDTAREDPLQLPILLRDVRDAGLRRVAGTLAHAVRDPIESKLPPGQGPHPRHQRRQGTDRPHGRAEEAARLLPRSELAVVPGSPHNANYSAADHLAELVQVFLRQKLPSRDVRN